MNYGDVRLVGGKYMWEGRVEVFSSGVWRSFEKPYSSRQNDFAKVVCRQLGYNTCKLFCYLSTILIIYFHT